MVRQKETRKKKTARGLALRFIGNEESMLADLKHKYPEMDDSKLLRQALREKWEREMGKRESK
jgi:hypothetical protein